MQSIDHGLEVNIGYDLSSILDLPQLPHLVEHKYEPTSVLITGVAGFIASHVAIRLTRLYPQYRVVGVDKLSYCSDERYVTEPLAESTNFRFVQGDVCDVNFLCGLMEEEHIDTVLHLAAQSHVDQSFTDGGPMFFARDNVMGTAAMLEASKQAGVRRFVHCSTDEVYGEGTSDGQVVFTESSPMKPNNPYAASKAGADLMAQSFFTSFGFPVIITRGNNVYGPHQYYDKVIPKFMTQLIMGHKITIHGTGRNVRSFLHAQDTASAFDAILHCGSDGEIYNIGGRNHKSVLEVAEDVLNTLGMADSADQLVDMVDDRSHNDASYPIACDKLQSLGWREQISWESGLAGTMVWLRSRLQHEHHNWGEIEKAIQAHPGPIDMYITRSRL